MNIKTHKKSKINKLFKQSGPNINVAPVFFSYYVMNISYLSYLNKASMEGNGAAERGGVGRKWGEKKQKK